MDKKILLQNLAENLVEHTGMTKRKAEAFVRSFFDITETALENDGLVKVKNFGTTKIISVNDRESVNINTGERFQIEGHDKITFTPDSFFRDLVNRPFAHFSTIVLEDEIDENELNTIASPKETILSDEPEDDNIEETEYPTASEIEDAAVMPIADLDSGISEQIASTAAEEEQKEEKEEQAEIQEEEENTTLHSSEETDTKADNSNSNDVSPNTKDTMQQPIIIQNTMPAENHHNWWRTAFIILITMVLMILSYLAGYYRVLCPCEIQDQETVTISHSPDRLVTKFQHKKTRTPYQPQVVETTPDEKEIAEKETTVKKTAVEDGKSTTTVTITPAKKKESSDDSKYRQMDGGEYLITGIIETHEMKVGDNLYKLARQAYGDKNLASYIVFHNKIDNPDIVQLGQKIEIPQLTRK